MITIKSYYISQGKTPSEHLKNIQKMVEAGVDAIQLRIKNLAENQWIEQAFKAQQLCKENGCIFIVNDSVSVAFQVNADGVHLGKNDTDPLKARELLGNNKIIGGTANTLSDCTTLIQKKVDYIGLGPYRFTTTKENLSPILGKNGYLNIINQLQDISNVPPIIAIGGIEEADFSILKSTGVSGIALSGFLQKSENPQKIIHQLQTLF